MPRVRRTSSTRIANEKVIESDEFMKDLVHENYNIWTGERDLGQWVNFLIVEQVWFLSPLYTQLNYSSLLRVAPSQGAQLS